MRNMLLSSPWTGSQVTMHYDFFLQRDWLSSSHQFGTGRRTGLLNRPKGDQNMPKRYLNEYTFIFLPYVSAIHAKLIGYVDV